MWGLNTLTSATVFAGLIFTWKVVEQPDDWTGAGREGILVFGSHVVCKAISSCCGSSQSLVRHGSSCGCTDAHTCVCSTHAPSQQQIRKCFPVPPWVLMPLLLPKSWSAQKSLNVQLQAPYWLHHQRVSAKLQRKYCLHVIYYSVTARRLLHCD